MTTSTGNQAYIFLAAIYGGLLVGLIYDFSRALRMITKPTRWFVAVLDILFWILAVILYFSILFRVNNGEIRLFSFVGFGMGWGLYALIVGSVVVKFLVKAFEIIKKIVLWPLKIILKPFTWIKRKYFGRKRGDQENMGEI